MSTHLQYSELSGGKKSLKSKKPKKPTKTTKPKPKSKPKKPKTKGGNALVNYGTPALTYGILSLLKKRNTKKSRKSIKTRKQRK